MTPKQRFAYIQRNQPSRFAGPGTRWERTIADKVSEWCGVPPREPEKSSAPFLPWSRKARRSIMSRATAWWEAKQAFVR